MGRIMSFGQDGYMVAYFDKSEHDFLRRYGRTPEEVMAENAKLRELADLLLWGIDNDLPPAEGLVWSQKVNALTRELGIEVGQC